MARRLRDHKEARVFTGAIEDLMRRLRCNGEAAAERETMLFTIELDGELTGENVEELGGVRMQVALFGGGGRHALFDHAEGAGAMEMPAVARLRADSAGPRVVFGIVGADGHLFTLAGATKTRS